MILSMTSFARHEQIEDFGTIIWELRSVNHRYLEPTFKMPEMARACEPLLRETLRTTITRGKVECMMRLEKNAQCQSGLQINQSLVNELIKANQAISQLMPNAQDEFPSTYLQWPGVIETAGIDKDVLQQAISSGFKQALKELIAHRANEGRALQNMLETRLTGIDATVELVKPLIPEAIKHQRQKLFDRFEEMAIAVDQDRIETELVILANKIDVDEELDRLVAHVTEVKSVLSKGSPCGRKLDFLMQELNREANTLGSKSILSKTSQASVELKVLIEQMREQVQNIE
ncbi:MAG: YicC family protein [Sinobacterium sp.]|nr:YicC family protein [Sinobacterium sp.]